MAFTRIENRDCGLCLIETRHEIKRVCRITVLEVPVVKNSIRCLSCNAITSEKKILAVKA
jgi:hypothetical protein